MLKEQNGLCTIGCGRIADAIDHNHSTGVVRGLICHQCNSALGLLMEDPLVIQSLLRYAAQHGCVRLERENLPNVSRMGKPRRNSKNRQAILFDVVDSKRDSAGIHIEDGEASQLEQLG